MTIKYGIVVIHSSKIKANKMNVDDIEHFCGYEEEPDWSKTKDDLKDELINDPEFKLEHDIEEYSFIRAPKELAMYYNSLILEDGD